MYLVAGLDFERIVMSSMNALSGVFTSAPFVSVDLNTISITRINNTTDIVHPAAIPTSSRYQSVVNLPVVIRITKLS